MRRALFGGLMLLGAILLMAPAPPYAPQTVVILDGGVTALDGGYVSIDGGYVTITEQVIPTSNLAAPSPFEVLVSNVVATSVSVPAGVRSCEIFNNGPNTIYCNTVNTAVANKCRPIAAGTAWTLDGSATALAGLNCIAATAVQVTGAATIVTCLK